MLMSVTTQSFNIWVCELHVAQRKLLDCQSKILNSTSPTEYNIIAIQEPYLDQFKNSHATPYWMTVYLMNHLKDKEERMRAVILINK